MTPPGISKNRQRIRRMFAGISRRYDLLNHLLSLNVDRVWRRKAVLLLDPAPGERILDLCTGTADLALEVARAVGRKRGGASPLEPSLPACLIVGTDFCPEMVRLGEKKRRRREGKAPGGPPVRLGVADTLHLPFGEGTFDAAAVAFGIRNVEDLDAAFREMLRVLRPSGRAAILEFSTPPIPWFRFLFGLYFKRILPWIGRLLSSPAGNPAGPPAGQSGNAYRYLPASVAEFPGPDLLSETMARAGFVRVRYRRLTLGIAAIHLGERPGPGAAPGGDSASGGASASRGGFALVLEPGSPGPAAEIGRVLAYHRGLHPSDAIARARYGGGVLLTDATAEEADALASRLAPLGVRARRIEASLIEELPRSRRIRSLSVHPDGLRAGLLSGGEEVVSPRDLFGIHLYALPHSPVARTAEARGTLGNLRALPGFRALARRPTSPRPEEERAAQLAEWFRRHHHDIGEALELSPRARKLREALAEAGNPPPRLHLTLLCGSPVGPLRLEPDDLDYSSLGERKRAHSLDNFLELLSRLLRFAPRAWMAERLGSFLERLDPADILYFKPEEGQNLERWMQAWIRISGEVAT